MKGYRIFLILFFSCAVLITGYGESVDEGGQRTLVIGTSAEYPPFEFLQNGKFTGIDVEIAREVGRILGVEVQIQDMDFAALVPALSTGRVDFVMAGMTITEERQENVDFSDVYYAPSLAVLSLESAPIKAKEDLAGKRVGVQLGSIMELYAKGLLGDMEGLSVESRNQNPQLVQELSVGRFDGVIIEESQAKMFASNYPSLVFYVLPDQVNGYAIAFRKGSILTEEFNRALAELNRGGGLQAIISKWEDFDSKEGKSLLDLLPSFMYIVKGLWVTLQYTFMSVACGLILGSLLSLCKISRNRWLNRFASFYTSIFRGTPLLLQLAVAYYAIPGLTGYQVPAFIAGVMAFSLNSAAYISEVIRAGVQAVDKGQFEAARALGVPYRLMMKDVIFPQAFRNILPALVNELVDMLKESAIISTIGQADLMRRAQIVAAEQYTYFTPLLVAGVCYYFAVLALSQLAQFIERRLKLS